MSSIISFALVLSALGFAPQCAGVVPAWPAIPPDADHDLSRSGRLAQRVEFAYARARPSVVLVEGRDGKNRRPRWRKTGVLVTGDGLLLCATGGKVDSIEVLLSDNRRVTGRIVGRSGEWGVALLRLDGDGPWPHVALDDLAGNKPGQVVMTLGFRVEGHGVSTSPAVRVETMTSAVPLSWVGTTGGNASPGWLGEAAFDLDGGLIGVGDTAYPAGQNDERFYAHVRLIKSFWADLVGGKDADLRRLWPAEERSETIRPFRPDAPIAQITRDRAIAATVRMREATKPEDEAWSGVLVDKDGLIITCAHHFKKPGVILSISLADGRNTTGRVIGTNPISDVGLVQITVPGDWPHVDRGDSRRLTPGAPCFVVGYPGELAGGHPPLVGLGIAIASSNRIAPVGLNLLHAKTDPPITGGQSGGGLFDPDGHLVGIVHGGNRLDGDYYARVELVRASLRELAPGAFVEERGPSELEEAKGELRQRAESVRKSLVTILNGDEPVALGTIVTRDGGILTKASALAKAPSCRLADGRTEPAKVVRISRKDDIALLRIAAVDLPAIEGWDSKDIPPVGLLLALPTAGGTTVVGSVTCLPRSIPPTREGEEFHHDGFPSAYEVAIPSVPVLNGGPVIDAMGRMRGVVVAEASDGWLIVMPSSSAQNLLHD